MLRASLFLLLPVLAVAAERPNVVFVIADDLGVGDLGCYGQKKIKTPNLDKLAAGGMRLTHHYAGCNVCAPSRCVLLTGKHTGHAEIRDNRQAAGFGEGQEPVSPGSLQLPLRFKNLGYAVGGFGKWGLGPVGSTGDPLKQGFDRFYGFNCQAKAHNHYPSHLWDDAKQVKLDNPPFAAHQKLPAKADLADPKSFAPYQGKDYAPDRIGEQALDFVRSRKDKPFFLYYATTIPHLALQVPDDSLDGYTFPEEPYAGGRGYLPHPRPRAAYAAMIARMDRDVGRLLDLLKELGLEDNTIVVFTSDNGPLYDNLGGTDSDFFDSAAGLRGRKGSYHEGGFRVPGIVRWPGKVAAGSTSDRVTGFEDWLPTLLALVGERDVPKEIDGIGFAPTLLGGKQDERPFLYRESPGYGGQQCVRVGDWKAIRKNLHPGKKAKDQAPGAIELYDLKADPAEKVDLASKHPDVVAKLAAVMTREHVASAKFPIAALDGKK